MSNRNCLTQPGLTSVRYAHNIYCNSMRTHFDPLSVDVQRSLSAPPTQEAQTEQSVGGADGAHQSDISSSDQPHLLLDHRGDIMRPDLLEQSKSACNGWTIRTDWFCSGIHADGRPRRPMNSFLIFSRHRRPQLQRNDPSMKTGQISGILSKEWKALGDVFATHLLPRSNRLTILH